jgi:hypothetical protein
MYVVVFYEMIIVINNDGLARFAHGKYLCAGTGS